MVNNRNSVRTFGTHRFTLRFYQDPDAEYIRQARVVLTKLKLHDILQRVMEKEEERAKLINEKDHCESEERIRESTSRSGTSRNDSKTSSGEPTNVASCLNSRKSTDIFLSTDSDNLSTLRELISDNDFFDIPNTPKAFNSNTPSCAERSTHDIIFDMVRDSTSSISTPVPNFSCGNPTHKTGMSDDTWVKEGTSNDTSAATKRSEGPFARFAPSSSKNNFSQSQSSDSLTKSPCSYVDSSDVGEGILPSNLNHYPKIFQLDSETEADIEKELSFSFKQEDPTQPLPRKRRQELQSVFSSRKRPNSDHFVNNGQSSLQMNSRSSDFKSMTSLQQLTSPKNTFTDERLKKFRFKRPTTNP